jgi:aminopeptidase N
MKNLVWLLLVSFLFACGTTKDNKGADDGAVVEAPPMPPEPPLDIIDDTYIDPERPIYRASETLLSDLVHTKLEVDFIWEKSQMNGVATITAKPHFYPSNNLILDAKGMEINSVQLDGKDLAYTYEDDFLNITLDKTYTRDDTYTVVIDYLSKPDEREEGGSAAITSDKGLYFINPKGEDEDKMPQIWTQGETEASSVWFPTVDQPNAKTTQEIFIKVKDKYTTLSNGKLISSKKVEDGMRIDHWKQDLAHAPYLFMMGIGEFTVVEDSYTRPDGTKMAVNYYVEPEWESNAKGIFGETPEMIKHFSELLGVEYPWDKYHQIVTRDYVSGAMENTGAVIFGDYVYRNERELLDGNDQSTIAHELFHHWFGDLVTCESWSNLPMNESFANYSQYLWDEHRYGVDEADYYAEQEAEGYYQSAGIQGYHDLIWFDYDDKEQMFDGHSYNKGGRILHMLRNYLGDDAFFAGLNHYLESRKFQAAEFHHLRQSFEEVSGEDLNWFFNQWFLGSGHPNLLFMPWADEENDKLIIQAYQKQDLELCPIYKLPFEIAYFDDEGKHVAKVEIDELEEEIIVPFKGTLKGFVIDNQQMLLGDVEVMDKSKEMYRYQYYNGERYHARKEGLKLGFDNSSASQQMILDALKDPFWHMRELALGKVSVLDEAHKNEGIASVKSMIEMDPKSRVRAKAIQVLESVLEDEMARKTLYANAVKTDQSYTVVTEALTGLATVDPELALEEAEKLENEPSSKMLFGICKLYATNGSAEKIDFFVSALNNPTLQGWDRLGAVNQLTLFVTSHDVEVAEKALQVYESQMEKGSYYMQMFLPQNVSYINESFTSKVVELNDELKAYEENDDAVYADQTRKKISRLEAIQTKYQALMK